MKTRFVQFLTIISLVFALTACSGPLAAVAVTPIESKNAAPARSDTEPAAALQPVMESQAQSPTRQIVVTGTGKANLIPDVAYINIGVNTQSRNVTEALTKNNEQSQALTDALNKMGVEEKDIQTISFNIYPQQQYDPSGEMTGILYVVDNVVSLTLRDLPRLGEMLDAAVRAGANSINSIQFDVQDKDKALSEARTEAVDKARKQAEELAKAAGVELGELVAINVYNLGSATPPFYGYGMGGGGGYAPMVNTTVPVSAGQLVLTVDVNLTYEIK
jgi:uncharacterized protein YggE